MQRGKKTGKNRWPQKFPEFQFLRMGSQFIYNAQIEPGSIFLNPCTSLKINRHLALHFYYVVRTPHSGRNVGGLKFACRQIPLHIKPYPLE